MGELSAALQIWLAPTRAPVEAVALLELPRLSSATSAEIAGGSKGATARAGGIVAARSEEQGECRCRR